MSVLPDGLEMYHLDTNATAKCLEQHGVFFKVFAFKDNLVHGGKGMRRCKSLCLCYVNPFSPRNG